MEPIPTIQFLFDNFGKTVTLLSLVFLFAAILVLWILVHRSTPAHTEISFLWGFVKYTKGRSSPPLFKREFTQIRIVDSKTGTLWRITKPPKIWIERDLTTMPSATIGDLLIGPHHEKSKKDLSYYEHTNYSYGSGWHIHSRCPDCKDEVVPKKYSVRHDHKERILKCLQEAYLRGDKIKNGMSI